MNTHGIYLAKGIVKHLTEGHPNSRMVTWFVHERVGIDESMFVKRAMVSCDEEFE